MDLDKTVHILEERLDMSHSKEVEETSRIVAGLQD